MSGNEYPKTSNVRNWDSVFFLEVFSLQIIMVGILKDGYTHIEWLLWLLLIHVYYISLWFSDADVGEEEDN